MTRRRYFGALSGSLAAAGIAEAQDPPAARPPADLSSFGIEADGTTDDTAAIQKALDEAAKTGATVGLPAARDLVKGRLKIPPGAGLAGIDNAVVGQWPLTVTGSL